MTRLRGSSHGRIDDKGRLKIPAVFRQQLEHGWGRSLFITSRDANLVRVYPLPIWEKLESGIEAIASLDPDRDLHLFWAGALGGESEIDNQGRVLLPSTLRDEFPHVGEVIVIGMLDHLAVATKEFVAQFRQDHPLTREHLAALSSRGV